jgi:hypothetical protein
VRPALGVDPGTEGGVAVLRGDGTVAHVHAFRPDMTRADFALVIRCAVAELRFAGDNGGALLEKVGYRPHDGGKGTFTFGRGYGWCEMALTCYGAPPRDVLPMMWQARLDCLTGGDKKVSRRRAEELFPSVRMTNAVADALLIAEYGRRVLNP